MNSVVLCQIYRGTPRLAKRYFLELDTPLGGLTSVEAEKRLGKYGENKLREPDKVPAFIRFISVSRSTELFADWSGFVSTRYTPRQAR